MLKDHSQLQLSLSPYQGLYDAIIPEDHLLRRIKENIDFSFVNPMLRKQYCENFGRPAKEPEMMFKLLFLKKLYDLSDEALISSAQTDMAYKFFLNLEPEAKMIDSSLLTKFRKTRITEDKLSFRKITQKGCTTVTSPLPWHILRIIIAILLNDSYGFHIHARHMYVLPRGYAHGENT